MTILMDMQMHLVRFLPTMMVCQLVLSLCRSYLGSPIFEFHWCSFPMRNRTHYLAAVVLSFWLAQSFCPLFSAVP